MKLFLGILAFILGFFPTLLSAHPLAPTLWELKETRPGEFAMLWKTPRANVVDSRVRPNLPAECRVLSTEDPQLADQAVLYRARIRCEGDLVGSVFQVPFIASSKADVIFHLTLADGRDIQGILSTERPAFTVPHAPSRGTVFKSYLALGFRHILTGLDHLLFIMGLFLLVRGWPQLTGTITAFTLGHSITLSLAALGWIQVSQAGMEVLIAVSLLYLAWELTKQAAGRDSLMIRHPWILAASFGLLHGLGFAGALREVGLPQGQILLGLFGFNVGIELGQLLFLMGLGLLAGAVSQVPMLNRQVLQKIPVYAIGSLSVFWLLDRLTLFF